MSTAAPIRLATMRPAIARLAICWTLAFASITVASIVFASIAVAEEGVTQAVDPSVTYGEGVHLEEVTPIAKAAARNSSIQSESPAISAKPSYNF